MAVSSLEHVTAAVNEAVAKVQNLGERVGILADRVFGQIDGDSREAAADRDAGDGTYGHLCARIGELERALGVLEAQLLRIEHV